MKPLVPIADDAARAHAQLIAAFSALVLIGSIAGVLISPTLYDPAVGARVRVMLLTVSSYLIPYVLARRGKIRAAVWTQALTTILNIFVGSALVGGEMGVQLHYLHVLVCVYAATFLNVSAGAVVAVIYLTALIAFVPQTIHPTLLETSISPFGFNIIGAMVALFIVGYWRQREAVHRRILSANEERYRVISEMTSDYMYYVSLDADANRTLEWVTESVSRFTGYSLAEVFARTDVNVHTDDVARVIAARTKVMEGEAQEQKYRYFRKDGRMIWVQVHTRPAYDAQGKVCGYYGAVRDITAQKEAQAQALHLALKREQFTTLEKFVAAMSHDFRNRLATIESSRYLIERAASAELGTRLQPRMETIHSSVKVMIEQLDNLSTLTTLGNLQLEECRLGDLIAEVCQALLRSGVSAGWTIEIDDDERLPLLPLDREKMSLAVRHLLNNAFEHTAQPGPVVVRCKRDGNFACLEVEDRGKGIEAEDFGRVFDPFFKGSSARTIDGSGVGLGLTLVKLIVEAHDGHVELESALGLGTTVHIRLPLAGPRSYDMAKPSAHTGVQVGSG